MVVPIELSGHGNYLLFILSFLVVFLDKGWFLRIRLKSWKLRRKGNTTSSSRVTPEEPPLSQRKPLEGGRRGG